MKNLSNLLADRPLILTDLRLIDWGQTLILTGTAGTAGDQPFELRYDDCRELQWRVYVHQDSTPVQLVDFAPGRDQQRSPAKLLTTHFGLTLYYGRFTVTSPGILVVDL